MEHLDYFMLNQDSLYCKEGFSLCIRLFCVSQEHSSLLCRPLGPWWLVIPSSTGECSSTAGCIISVSWRMALSLVRNALCRALKFSKHHSQPHHKRSSWVMFCMLEAFPCYKLLLLHCLKQRFCYSRRIFDLSCACIPQRTS